MFRVIYANPMGRLQYSELFPTEAAAEAWARQAQKDDTFDVNDADVLLVYPDLTVREFSINELEPD